MMAVAAQQCDLVPREPREPCRVETVIVDDCDRELAAWLGNTSDHGFMADCEEKLPLGAIVDIRLPDRGMVRAEVRWAVGWRFGALILD
jgi:hypothetical protein